MLCKDSRRWSQPEKDTSDDEMGELREYTFVCQNEMDRPLVFSAMSKGAGLLAAVQTYRRVNGRTLCKCGG